MSERRDPKNRQTDTLGAPFSTGVSPESIVDDLQHRRGERRAARIGKPAPRVSRIGSPETTVSRTSAALGRKPLTTATESRASNIRSSIQRAPRARSPITSRQSSSSSDHRSNTPQKSSKNAVPRDARPTHTSRQPDDRRSGDDLQPIRVPRGESMRFTSDNPVRVHARDSHERQDAHASRGYQGDGDDPVQRMKTRVAQETERYESAARDALRTFQSRQDSLSDSDAASRYAADAEDAARAYESTIRREAAAASAELEKQAREKAKQSVRAWKAALQVESQPDDETENVQTYHYTTSTTDPSLSPQVSTQQGAMSAPFRERAPASTKKDGEKSGFPTMLLWGLFIFGIFAINLCDSM